MCIFLLGRPAKSVTWVVVSKGPLTLKSDKATQPFLQFDRHLSENQQEHLKKKAIRVRDIAIN